MKHILVISRSYRLDQPFEHVLNKLRKANIRYERHRSDVLITEHVTYHFIQVGKRNLSRFLKKHGTVDAIFATSEIVRFLDSDKFENPLYEVLRKSVKEDLSNLHTLAWIQEYPVLMTPFEDITGLSVFDVHAYFHTNDRGDLYRLYLEGEGLESDLRGRNVYPTEREARQEHVHALEYTLSSLRRETQRIEDRLDSYKSSYLQEEDSTK